MDQESVVSLRNLDRRYHLHPFTDHKQMHKDGTYIIDSAKGCWVKDEKGQELLDGLAGLWCVNSGYGQEKIIEAITDQLRRLSFYPSFFNSTTETSIKLAEKLVQIAPKNMGQVMFCNSGSEANETALKLIRWIQQVKGNTNKKKVITRQFSYHGVGIASGSLTSLETCLKPFGLPLDNFVRVPGPYAYHAGRELEVDSFLQECLDSTIKVIEREGPESIAAMFVEPIQGAGGVVIPTPDYLKSLREICKQFDILFVADEVITGFGRVGEWFMSEPLDLQPDMISMAKGLTSGYVPLGGTMVSQEISDLLNNSGYLAHGFTYSGHPVGCAAALANIEFLESERVLETVREELSPYFTGKLTEFQSHPAVGEVRCQGLIGALELLPRGGRSELSDDLKLGIKGAHLARERRVIVRGIRNMVAIAPPLVIDRNELDFLFAGLEAMLDSLWS